jgi:hypothetical protein
MVNRQCSGWTRVQLFAFSASSKNPKPTGQRAIKKWSRKWRENRDAVLGQSWAAQLEAEDDFESAQMVVPKIKPRDMHELTLKAGLSGVYDKVHVA